MILELFFLLILLGPFSLFLYFSKQKSKEYKIFFSIVIVLLSIITLGYILLKMINKSALVHHNEVRKGKEYVARNFQHIFVYNNKENAIIIEYNLCFTKEEKITFGFTNNNQSYNSTNSLHLKERDLSIYTTPYTVRDSFILPESFYIKVLNNLKIELDCIDKSSFFKRARYNKEINAWELEIK